MSKKTIGILGGFGPEATIETYKKIIEYSQKWYGAKYDGDYPPIFIFNLPIADVVENFDENNSVFDELAKGAKKLESVDAEFIIMPCNTLDYFVKDLRKEIKIPFLSIVDETIREVKSKGISSVGLLSTEATIKNNLYLSNNSGIKLILPSQKEQKIVTEIIMNILSGKKNEEDKNKLKDLILSLQTKGAEAIILGCTDLPLLITQKDVNIPLFDTIDILAKVAVKKSNLIKNYINNQMEVN